jgi:predicted  nucleic acid-binding Zn-ribbon protein
VASLDDLLTVQLLDTRIDQLRHQHRTLAQRAALVANAQAQTVARAAADECAGRLKALRSSQKEAEDHASLLDDKATAVNTSLYDGSVTSHKELESLQAEHRQLKEHQAQFEDQALELMEQAEPVESELGRLQATVDELVAAEEALRAELVVAEAELDVQLDAVTAERAEAVAAVPDDVVATYENLRAGLGGVAVAKLNGSRCEGCHLEIPSAELDAIRRAPADAVVTCPDCARLLVR